MVLPIIARPHDTNLYFIALLLLLTLSLSLALRLLLVRLHFSQGSLSLSKLCLQPFDISFCLRKGEGQDIVQTLQLLNLFLVFQGLLRILAAPRLLKCLVLSLELIDLILKLNHLVQVLRASLVGLGLLS